MFTCTQLDSGFGLEMSTDLANVDRCVERIDLFLRARDAAAHLFPLSLLAREALNNAMVHGNQLDPAKTVRFRLLALEGGFEISVEDEGEGFKWQERLQASSDVEAVSGRGHEIFRIYAASVRYNPRGNALTLEYRG
jgi:serine/threonine-protein kinase RsbW